MFSMILTGSSLLLLLAMAGNHFVHGFGCWGLQPGGRLSSLIYDLQILVSVVAGVRLAVWLSEKKLPMNFTRLIVIGIGLIASITMFLLYGWAAGSSLHHLGIENLFAYLTLAITSLAISNYPWALASRQSDATNNSIDSGESNAGSSPLASDNPYASPLTDSQLPVRVDRTFCGLQPNWTTPDRFYKFYITKETLYAGWIGGQFHDKLSVRYGLWPIYLILVGIIVGEPLAIWADNRRCRLQSLYDSLIEEPDVFLAADSRNMMIARKNIQSIKISSRKSSWTFWANSGIITLNIHYGKSIRLLIRDTRDLNDIVDELVDAGYPVVFEG
ncbi:MAG: hypothetical protein COA78_19220 [Blastopirellula sp.]|nr:MAG: hypothetical protein COA78_19220 [Blastopirellula sp.]